MLFEIIMEGCLQFHLAIQKQSLLQPDGTYHFRKLKDGKFTVLLSSFFGVIAAVRDLCPWSGTELGSLRCQMEFLSFLQLKGLAPSFHARSCVENIKMFMTLLMIEINLCMNFSFWPKEMENYVKNALFPPYHLEKANGEKVWSENRHSYM